MNSSIRLGGKQWRTAVDASQDDLTPPPIRRHYAERRHPRWRHRASLALAVVVIAGATTAAILRATRDEPAAFPAASLRPLDRGR